MKDIIDSDPSSADNTSLMRFATHLCSRLPHSDGIVSQNLEVDWRAKELGWSEEDKTQAYHQLYSFVTETVNKIKATISPVPHLKSEVRSTFVVLWSGWLISVPRKYRERLRVLTLSKLPYEQRASLR